MSRLLSLVTLTALLGATQPLPSAPFEPASFAIGKPAGATSGRKPAVIVMFASWCVGCIEEIPTVLRDYQRFKDRVNFIGVDYLDNAEAGAAMVAKYDLPFPIFASHANADAPPPATAGENAQKFSMHAEGMPPSLLAKNIPVLAKQLPAEDVKILQDVANACEHLDDASCRAYALARGVDFGPAPSGSPTAKPAATAGTQSYLTLPHLFIVDAHGIVRADVDGYTRGQDDIARELSKLGIR